MDRASKTFKQEYTIKNSIMDDIDRYLQEDLGKDGDITSDALFTNEPARATVIAKEACVVAGLEEAQRVFTKTHATATLLLKDGTIVRKGTPVLEIRGTAKSILKGERLALNFIGRMSGIASEVRLLVDRCRKINPNVTIAATRKTTPGFRSYEKKAVILGGGEPHRYGLYDGVLIKDNHLKLVGSVQEALKRVQGRASHKTIEIEVENEHDALAAAKRNVDVIMLDNIAPKKGKAIAGRIRQINPHIHIEVSGGITRDTIMKYAAFADRISLGALTHSV
jgi:nicotinate-nucleotide pyrophosphorylase (carboxylating)